MSESSLQVGNQTNEDRFSEEERLQNLVASQASRIQQLERQLQESKAAAARKHEQLNITRTLLLLKNVDVAAGSPDKTTDKIALSAASGKTRNSAVSDQSETVSATQHAVSATTAIEQLRRVKLLKHSWHQLREDATRLQRGLFIFSSLSSHFSVESMTSCWPGIPKVTEWVASKLLAAAAVETAKTKELQERLEKLAELFE